MNIPTRILAPALSILLAVTPLAGATAHALPQNDDESAYLATIDALFTQTFTILSDCKAYAVSQDQQAQCVVDGYIELKSTWEGVPVPTRSKYIDGAFGRYLKNSISNFHILNTLVAETAGGDGTYDPKTVLSGSRVGLMMRDKGLMAEVEYCAQFDLLDVVARLEDGVLRRVNI